MGEAFGTQRVLEDVGEITGRTAAGEGVSADAPRVAEHWKRVVVVPGVELHLRGDLPKPKPKEVAELLVKLETALRKGIG